jgi:SAM-dependent methyltransferase
VSLDRLERHLAIWREKPELRRVYEVWFDLLLDRLPPRAVTLEVGAGMGAFSSYARHRRPDLRWISTDLSATPWNDVVADALHLPFRDRTVDAVVGVDVLHHLARPRWFFTEAARVLRLEGRLALVEPWVSVLSFPIYRWFHQEGCSFQEPWRPFAETGDTTKAAFDGNAAVLRLLVRRTPPDQWPSLGFDPPRLELLNGLAYLLTLGFRKQSLLPAGVAAGAIRIDRWTRGLAPLLALRAVAVWMRRAPAAGASVMRSDLEATAGTARRGESRP